MAKTCICVCIAKLHFNGVWGVAEEWQHCISGFGKDLICSARLRLHYVGIILMSVFGEHHHRQSISKFGRLVLRLLASLLASPSPSVNFQSTPYPLYDRSLGGHFQKLTTRSIHGASYLSQHRSDNMSFQFSSRVSKSALHM